MDLGWLGVYEDLPLALLIALAVTLVATPLVGRVARNAGVVAHPGERHVHRVPTPLLGGIAILLGVLTASLLVLSWDAVTPLASLQMRRIQFILIGAVLITLLGTLDDIRVLGWKTKLAGQFAIACVPVFGPLLASPGDSNALLNIEFFDPPFLPVVDIPLPVGVLITVVWIVALMNIVNFIDGVDGLAAGVCAISAATFAVLAASVNRSNVAVLAAATCGAAVGFLRYNFQRDHARIFMGDSGSMLLGYLLAVIAIQGVLKTAATVALVIPLVLLAVPILDTLFVVAKRMKYRTSIASPDRWHLHHRFLNLGYTPRRVAVNLWIWTASMSAIALALRFVNYHDGGVWNPTGLAILGAFVVVGLGLSTYMVVTLEIIKLRRVRERNAAVLLDNAIEQERAQEAAAAASNGSRGDDRSSGPGALHGRRNRPH